MTMVSFLVPQLFVMVAIYVFGCVTVICAAVTPVDQTVLAFPVLNILEKLPQYVVSLPMLNAVGGVKMFTLMVSDA